MILTPFKRLDKITRCLHASAKMSHSKFEYTRKFEADDKLLPNAWIVVRYISIKVWMLRIQL